MADNPFAPKQDRASFTKQTSDVFAGLKRAERVAAQNPFAPKQDSRKKAKDLQGFFSGKAPKTDDQFEGTALLDPLRGFVEGAEGLAAGAAKFGGFVADQFNDPELAGGFRDLASKIEFEMQRGFEAKGRGITSRSFAEVPVRKSLRLAGQAIPSLLFGFGGGAFATKVLAKAGLSGRVARELGFTLSTIPLAAVEGGQFYQEGLDAGKTSQELLASTSAVMLGTAVLERAVPLTWWINGTSGGTQLVKTALQESGEEVAQTIWTNIFKVMGWQGSKDLYNKLMDGVAESMVGGLLGGGLAGSVNLAAQPQQPGMKIDISEEKKQQALEILTARGVKDENGEPVTIDTVTKVAEAMKRTLVKQEPSILKFLTKLRGRIPNTNAMLLARQDKPHFEEASVQKDPKDGKEKVVHKQIGKTHAKLGGLLGNLTNEALKSGNLTKKELDKLIFDERTRKTAVVEAYEKLNIQVNNRSLAFNELPTALRAIIENEAPIDQQGLQDFINNELGKWVVYVEGGDPESPRAQVFFGPLAQYVRKGWRSGEWKGPNISPSAFIEDFVTFLAQVKVTQADGSVTTGIDPKQLVVRGEGAESVMQTILDQFTQQTIGIPSEELGLTTPAAMQTGPTGIESPENSQANRLNEASQEQKQEKGQAKLDKELVEVNSNPLIRLTEQELDDELTSGSIDAETFNKEIARREEVFTLQGELDTLRSKKGRPTKVNSKRRREIEQRLFELEGGEADDKAVQDIADENGDIVDSIPAQNKLKSDTSRFRLRAVGHWRSYGTPQAYIDAMTDAMAEGWAYVTRNVKGAAKQNSEMYQLIVERGEADFTGFPMDSVENAVLLTSVFRNPSVEVNQVAYVKDGVVISHSAFSINSPIASPQNRALINATLKRTGADGFYMVHNHPSGQPDLSPKDVEGALYFKKASDGTSPGAYSSFLGKYRGLVATDGESYNYISPNVSIEDHQVYLDTIKKTSDLPALRNENPVIADFQKIFKTKKALDFDIFKRKETGGQQLAADLDEHGIVATTLKDNISKSKVTVILSDSRGRFLQYAYLNENLSDSQIGAEIVNLMQAHKAATYSVVVNEKTVFGKAVGKLSNQSFSKKALQAFGKSVISTTMPAGIHDVIIAQDKNTGLVSTAHHAPAAFDAFVGYRGSNPLTPAGAEETNTVLPGERRLTFFRGHSRGRQLNVSDELREAQTRRIGAIEQSQREGIETVSDEDLADTISGFPDSVHREDYPNVPSVTLEKVGSMDEAISLKSRMAILNELKKAYDSNDAAVIKELEQNIDTYMDEADEGIMNRQEHEASEVFAVSGEAKIISFPKDQWSKARQLTTNAGRRINFLKSKIQQLEFQRSKAVTPAEKIRINKEITVRRQAMVEAEKVRAETKSVVGQERRARVKDKVFNAVQAIVRNPINVQNFQTKEKFTLPPGRYEVIKFADNEGQIKLMGQGFEIDFSLAAMSRWAQSDVSFFNEDEVNARNDDDLNESVGEQAQGTKDPFSGPDVKVDRAGPSPSATKFDWKLNTFIRVGKFVGITEEDTVQRINKYFNADVENEWVVSENKTDKATLQEIVTQVISERNYSGLAEMAGAMAEDILTQEVDKYVGTEFPHLQGKEKQDMVRFWLEAMAPAAEEVIAVGDDMNKFVYSNKGFEHYFADGSNPANINSEGDANVALFIKLHTQIRGAAPIESVIKKMTGDATRKGRRPEAMFWSMMPKQLQNLILWNKTAVEDPLFLKMINSDVLSRANNVDNRLNGYTPHAWRFDPKETKQRGGKQVISSTRQPPRTYSTYAEFAQAVEDDKLGVGLEVINNYATATHNYLRNSMISVNQRETIQKMINVIDPADGLPVVTWQNDKFILSLLEQGEFKGLPVTEARIENFLKQRGYRQLKNAEGLALRSKGAFFRPWVKGDVADLLDQFYADRSNPGWWNKINGFAKRVIMSSPYQFAMQIVSSPALWYQELGLVEGTKATYREAIAPLLPFQLAAGVKQEFVNRKLPFKNIETGYDLELVELFVKHGLKSFNTELVLNSLYDHKVMDSHPLLRPLAAEHWETLKGKFGLDNYVFNQYVAKNMYNFTKTFYDKGLRAGLDKEQAALEAVKFASDTSGMLNRNIFGNEGAFLQGTLFARDFTVSFFRQLTGATFKFWPQTFKGYKVGAAGNFNSFLHADASNETLERLQPYYAAHLTRILAAKMFFLSLAQFGLWYLRPEDDREERDKWMLLNEDLGKQIQIKMPFRDDDGVARYVDPLAWREINQFINFFPGLSGRGPADFIKGKLNVGISQLFDQVNNTDFKGDPITNTGIPIAEQLKDRFLFAAKQITPPFLREEVRGLSNLSAIVGFPQKAGSRFSTNQAKARQVFRLLSVAENTKDKLTARVKNADRKQLLALLALGKDNGGISFERYRNELERRGAATSFNNLLLKNRKSIEEQQLKELVNRFKR